MNEPYRNCPSYSDCSAPLCPLDPLLYKRVKLEGEDVCKAEKPTIKKIAKEFGIKLTPAIWRKIL